MTNDNKPLTAQDLAYFMGSEQFYKHWTKRLIYTEGVQYMAEKAGAYWLIDAIASYQPDKRIKDNPDLVAFQVWKLEIKESKAVLTMRGDSNLPSVIRQEIPYTDFPLPEITLYVCDGTLLLPSEY